MYPDENGVESYHRLPVFISLVCRRNVFVVPSVNEFELIENPFPASNEGDVAGATAEYREALRWQTNSVEARVNLADLLATHGQSGEALTLYEQAVALEPENPIARYNFGRLLTAEHRAAEAVTNFQVALRQQRDLPQHDLGAIHFELGNALAGLGRDSEALDEFAQAARLIPGFADVHLNYGAALARSRRYAAAAAEFSETLRLRPQDDRAQRMLDQTKNR